MKYRAPRMPTDVPIHVSAANRVHRATLVNVSTSGMRLTGVGAITPLQRVKVSTRTLLLAGVVVWTKGDQSGVRLDRPLSEAEFRVLRGTTARYPAPNAKPNRRHVSSAFREL